MQPGIDLETVTRECNCGFEQLGPRQLSIFTMGLLGNPEWTDSPNSGSDPSACRNQLGSAPAGAFSRPSNVVMLPPASPRTRKPPPPMPELCGSTTVKASITAIAASTAFPPACSIARPASSARGSAALTSPASARLDRASTGEARGSANRRPSKMGNAKSRSAMIFLMSR